MPKKLTTSSGSKNSNKKRNTRDSNIWDNIKSNIEKNKKVLNGKNNKTFLKWAIIVIVVVIIILIIWALFFRSSDKYESSYKLINQVETVITDTKSPDSKTPSKLTKNIDWMDSVTFSLDNNNNYHVTIKNLWVNKKKIGDVYTIMNYSEGSWYSSSQVATASDSKFQFNGWAGEQAIGDRIHIPKASNTFEIIDILISLLPIIIIIIIIYFMYRYFSKKGGIGGLGGMRFKKKGVKSINTNIVFDDVAGYEEEKFELIEVLDFLKHPKEYNSKGVRIPKGLLLVGEPGTGKTLLAKAVAGEAKVPFFEVNGSEFVELFVGMGAQRVRDLFINAKKQAPCIIFIDEIDTIGRVRGISVGGSNDEREQTLNQLLVELDGFNKRENVIVIAATNRFDVLDPALLRPGRFDRTIRFHSPTAEERYEILKRHSMNKNIHPNVDLHEIAKRTPGFTGAQLENVLNEACLMAIRERHKAVTMKDIDEAIDRVIGGLAKKSKKYIKTEKKLVAYHESGHAICGLVLDGAQKIQKITIIPRGLAGGYTLMTPKQEKFFISKKEIIEKVIGYLSGRAAEEIIFGKENVTSGSHNDIEMATNLARKMVTELGMHDGLGMVKYDNLKNTHPTSGFDVTLKPSSEFASKIDNAIKVIIEDSYKKSLKIINENMEILHLLAKALILKETINEDEINYMYKNRELPDEFKKADLEKNKNDYEKNKERERKESNSKENRKTDKPHYKQKNVEIS